LEDLKAIEEAEILIKQEEAKPLFYALDYYMLKNANPTDKKGNSNSSEKRKYTKQAENLFNIITTGKANKEIPYKAPMSEAELKHSLEELKLTLPKYVKNG